MLSDRPPELRETDHGHRPVQSPLWRAVTWVLAVVLIGMLIVAYVM